jgi:translation initiation factor 1 (eIF-1/SUI1)
MASSVPMNLASFSCSHSMSTEVVSFQGAVCQRMKTTLLSDAHGTKHR